MAASDRCGLVLDDGRDDVRRQVESSASNISATCKHCGEPVVGRRGRICEECAQQPQPEGEPYAPPCFDEVGDLAERVTVTVRGGLRGAWCGSFER